MQKSIISLGSLWYTAWVDAGQPDLMKLDEAVPNEEQLSEEELLQEQYLKGKAKGREHPH